MWRTDKCYSAKMKYLEGLNDAQKDAVFKTEGPVSVLAGAGSGKTRVLTTRIYHLIRKGVPADKILAVTFTNKATREMRHRIQSMLNISDHGPNSLDSQMPFIATFHGLGRELLLNYGKSIGIPRFFSIYDRDDSEKAVAAALKMLGIESKEMSPRTILHRISRYKNDGMRVQEFYEKYRETSFGSRILAEAWFKYEKILTDARALDFDDLISMPVRLLEEHKDIKELSQERWSYVHIDEYQDTNILQEKLAGLLAEKHRNIFVVGDGDQAIYGWRGAKMENILNFEKKYKECQIIFLERNYRSTKNLIDAANSVIKKNKNRKEKYLTTQKAAGEPIVLFMAANAEDEALWVARKIKLLMANELRKPEEIAILYRTNFQSRALEEGLLREGVPYKVLGIKFFARKEVKDVLAWIRLAMDPSREVDKIRAATSPPRGIGKITLGKLVAGGRAGLRAGELRRVEVFERIIDELSKIKDTLTPSEFVKLVIEKSGMKKALYDEGSEEDRERFENIEELASVASRHDGSPGEKGIALFLAEAALAGDQDEMDLPSKGFEFSAVNCVTLMTVHAAKGLEFDTVFITGMEEGLFPHENIGKDNDHDEEEERRLFYVAITRAKERLFLSLARIRKIYGSDFITKPSSFLADIDSSLIVYDENREYDISF